MNLIKHIRGRENLPEKLVNNIKKETGVYSSVFYSYVCKKNEITRFGPRGIPVCYNLKGEPL